MSKNTTNSKGREARAGEIFLLNPSELIFEEGFNKRINYTGIEELAESIKNAGQINPVRVYKVRSGENKGKYLVRVGHRRTLACQLLQESDPDVTIQAIKLASNDPVENLFMQFNSQTEVPLNDVEKGNVILALREEGVSDSKIQERIGVSVAGFYNLIALAQAPEDVQQAIADDLISGTTVNAIIRDHSEGRGAKRTVNNEAISAEVKSLIEEAQSSTATAGKKGKKVTGANRKGKKSGGTTTSRTQSLASKLSEFRHHVNNGAVSGEVIDNFIEVITALEEADSVQDVLVKFG